MARPRPPLTVTTYTDRSGRPRELVIRSGAHGSLLVLDRDPVTLCDRRLVAHIPADEPPENALLVSRMYAREGGRACRRLLLEDLVRAPLPRAENEREAKGLPEDEYLRRDGSLYRLCPHPDPAGDGLRQLRWSTRCAGQDEPWTAITLREVLSAFESYEPVCSLTLSAIARHGHDGGVSVKALRRELTRLQQSAFVLNRGLREAVTGALQRRGASLGGIALRCGMVKRDKRGSIAGDASWLARRVGLAPEGGKREPTRWVHSDTLALIARRGLGISPREVELG